MISKYLSDLGVKEKDLPWNWNPGDGRHEFWSKQREEFGFDERDTWSLDYTLILLIYPRLKMYNEVNGINTSYHQFEYKNNTYTQQECIDKIIEGFEIYLSKSEYKRTEEDWTKIEDARMLLAIISPALWW
jgi:hypothetical protein